MSVFNKAVGPIHFIGIGGIGMSGIAEVMANLGFAVQGSDIAEGYVVQGLRKKGITVHIGHKAENLGDAAVVVVSTAIKRGNPEVDLALERHAYNEQRICQPCRKQGCDHRRAGQMESTQCACEHCARTFPTARHQQQKGGQRPGPETCRQQVQNRAAQV